MGEQLSFQIADGGSIPTSPLQFDIRAISHRTAAIWITRWHYSHRIPTGKNLPFGLYVNGELYAVIVYGIGVNPYESAYLGCTRCIEIKRMCRSEPKLAFHLSRFIRITIKLVSKEYPFDAVIAFADPSVGHEGIVYKASGFTLEGMTSPEWHLKSADGVIRHRRYAFRYARRNNVSIGQAREELALTREKTPGKYRWVLRFGACHD